VSEHDIELVHAAEKASGRELLKNKEVTDDIAVTMLGTATKASRLAKLKLQDIGFDELVQKFKERKARDRKVRQRIEKALRKQEKAAR
jgi:ATP-dependent RNA helicase DDX49/DBP8